VPVETSSTRISPQLLTGLRVWAEEARSGTERRAVLRLVDGLAVADVETVLAKSKLTPLLRQALTIGLKSDRQLGIVPK